MHFSEWVVNLYWVTNFHWVLCTNKVIIVFGKLKGKKHLTVPKLRCDNVVEMFFTETELEGEYRRDMILRSFAKFWKFIEYPSDFSSFSRRSWKFWIVSLSSSYWFYRIVLIQHNDSRFSDSKNCLTRNDKEMNLYYQLIENDKIIKI